MNLESSIICFCNPLLDISAKVSKGFLQKFKLNVNDQVLSQPHHKDLLNEMVRDYNVDYIAGGSGQNTCRAIQRLLPKFTAIYVGSIGSDEYGRILKRKSEECGIRAEYQVSKKPTGTCAVLITDKNR